MNYTFYEIAMLFFIYSFLAWLAETAVATIKVKNFRNRGFASGPFCFIYGCTGVILTVFFQELKNDTFFLFLGSAAVATAVEWFTGKTLERMKQKKWWDYSGKKWNFDGYICLQYSFIWGLLGFLAVRYVNDFIFVLYNLLPDILGKILVWALIAIGLIDLSGSLMSVYHIEEKLPRILGWNHKLQKWTFNLTAKISGSIGNRIGRAYPSITPQETAESEDAAERCSLVQLFWLFLIAFNLGGRINLLYCFFWGIAAVVWMKALYPKMSRLVNIILRKSGRVLTVIFAVFMALDICVSVMALVRYDTRVKGSAAVHKWESVMDEYFDDEKMQRIYPNAIQQ